METLTALANLYADSGRDEQAVLVCEQAIKADNLSGEIYFTLGLVRFKKREYKDALSLLKKTLYCDEAHFLARFYLGLTYKELARDDDARRELVTTVALIQSAGPEALRREIAGQSGSYILSLSEDYLR